MRSSIGAFRVCASSNDQDQRSSGRERVDQRDEPRVHVGDERGLVTAIEPFQQEGQAVDDGVGIRPTAGRVEQRVEPAVR